MNVEVLIRSQHADTEELRVTYTARDRETYTHPHTLHPYIIDSHTHTHIHTHTHSSHNGIAHDTNTLNSHTTHILSNF